ncbi:hypothetical protein H8S90_13485 [Olivibacter sp. SDN3]|uniref:hypothetical protein n=1 Tax=Olivibacter sp. SDN3 TaxID=2764720 RepID=UPI00165143E9|nr:hypothetical protein [Olivibacter sp. SDN3]QNL47833.1 hypothetical protein H8S90_13485 [Olivibacter sp. SDN3]
MLTTYKILIALIIIFALGHMAYTFYYDDFETVESKMWFFSAGLAMLFDGFINLIYTKLKLPVVKFSVITANLSMLVFLILLSNIIPEPHVMVLTIIMLGTTIITALLRR